MALTSCKIVKSYAPPPQKAVVEKVEITLKEFAGRPEVYARVRGRLSTSVAQIVDSPQRRADGTIYLDVMEQTPRGATLLGTHTESPSFERIIPIDIFGLEPGSYPLSVNGIETTIEIPQTRALALGSGEARIVPDLRQQLMDINRDLVVETPQPEVEASEAEEVVAEAGEAAEASAPEEASQAAVEVEVEKKPRSLLEDGI